jgi:hypothetical protein
MTKAPDHPLSDDDKAAFDLFVTVWQERLGLQDWRIKRAKKTAAKANMAEVKIFHPNRMANVYLGASFGPNTTVTPGALEGTALHELLHVFLAELVNQTEYGIEGEALESAEHRVIHVLEKLLMDQAK